MPTFLPVGILRRACLYIILTNHPKGVTKIIILFLLLKQAGFTFKLRWNLAGNCFSRQSFLLIILLKRVILEKKGEKFVF
jgi:hypothetical protein